MQPVSPYLFLCNIHSNIIFPSKHMPFKWSLSSNQHVSVFLFAAWVLRAPHILFHLDCRPWQAMWMIKNYKAQGTYFSSVSLRFFFTKANILLCGFCLPFHFHALIIFLPNVLLPYALKGQKEICNNMCDLSHSAVVSTQIYIPLPGRVNRPETLQTL